jgi:hypothetical protein
MHADDMLIGWLTRQDVASDAGLLDKMLHLMTAWATARIVNVGVAGQNCIDRIITSMSSHAERHIYTWKLVVDMCSSGSQRVLAH